MSTPFWAVAYMVGGPDRFQWCPVLERYPSRDAALAMVDQLKRGGYHSLVSKNGWPHGLPETWDAGQSPSQFTLRGGWYVPA